MRRPFLLAPLLVLLPAACTAAPGPGADDPAGAKTPAGDRRRPRPGADWQWQLSGRLDTSVDVPVHDIDGFDHSKGTVAKLHRDGRKAICCLSTGAWEDFRPDADDFPASVIGRGNGWEGERRLDIRRTDVLEPLMARRLDMCREKGFDAVEPDDMDGYRDRTGFPLTADDQLRCNRLLARLAHERGMAVGLKNDLDQIPEPVDDFDFAADEQCAPYDECAEPTPFVEADKAVFHVEYELTTDRFCADSRRLELSSLLKKYEPDAWRRAC
ncbi:endo alpha-1,4 polygalactosaminidase [Streptomyces caelestis]|uniref:Endo alpha-1,4 polygalactosaminidase n=1 Tax=Streptomyces heliomycini TaxID=284032 RepID=A0ABV5LKJ1_9ACTN|nr:MULTISPECIES: endo alpha-1,4 polygalactosaminidase [Streptomyces]